MPHPAALLRRLNTTPDPDPVADLVRRHAGLVWGVCRRALPHRPDAEDAFQATWLVLAANPAVRHPAAFLHTVAVRTCRRVRQKRPATADASQRVAPEPPDATPLAALDEELARLPERLRRPLVLVYLDGATQAEAANSLGLSLSTLKRRLDDGKAVLKARLSGRGIDAAAALAAAGTVVGVPAVAAGSAAAVALSTEVLSAMWTLKLKGWAAGLVVAAGLAAGGGGLILADDPGQPGPRPGKAGGRAAVVRPVPQFQCETDNPEAGRRLVEACERARRELAVRWLGKELPPWPFLCPVHYQEVTDDGRAAGSATLSFDSKGLHSAHIHLFGPLDALLADQVPREVMHTVMATHFGKALPRWAETGLGVLAQSERSRQEQAVRNAEFLNAGRGIHLRALFPMTELPKDTHVLFAQGYAVCRWLLALRDEARLLEFIGRGMRDGWEPAAAVVYGFASLGAMQAEWIESLRGPAPAGKPPAPGATARLVRERRQAASRFLDLDREIRRVGAIPREESATFEANMSRTAQELYEATCAEFPGPAYRLLAATQWYTYAREGYTFYRDRAERGLNREQVALSALLARNRAESALFQAVAQTTAEELIRQDTHQPAPVDYVGSVAKSEGGWVTVQPAKPLTTRHLLTVRRDGKAVGRLVVIESPGPGGEGTLATLPLPGADGATSEVKPGDEVRP